MRKYFVTLPIEVDGVIHEFGSVIELSDEVAKLYCHALIAWEPAGRGPAPQEENRSGRNS